MLRTAAIRISLRIMFGRAESITKFVMIRAREFYCGSFAAMVPILAMAAPFVIVGTAQI